MLQRFCQKKIHIVHHSNCYCWFMCEIISSCVAFSVLMKPKLAIVVSRLWFIDKKKQNIKMYYIIAKINLILLINWLWRYMYSINSYTATKKDVFVDVCVLYFLSNYQWKFSHFHSFFREKSKRVLIVTSWINRK